jgi:hypothetical protein
VFMQNLKSCLVVDLLFGSGGIELPATFKHSRSHQ